jgi:kynurenine formamidase
MIAQPLHVVDLTVTLSEKLPCAWPGHAPFAHKNSSWFTEVGLPTGETCQSLGPYQTNFMILDEHCGTHVDGPTHFIPPPGSGLPWAGPLGELSGERLDLARLIGPAAVVDLRFLSGHSDPGISPHITRAHLETWEQANAPFQSGDVVLLWTDWSRLYAAGPEGRRYVHGPLVTRSSPAWPALDPEGAIFLSQRGVTTVGTDAPSMGSAQDGAPVHWEGLSRGMLFVEVLTNLGRLPPRGALFIFLPLKIAASTGGPGRAIAILDQADASPAQGSRDSTASSRA